MRNLTLVLFAWETSLIRGVQLLTRRRLLKQWTSSCSRSRPHGHPSPCRYSSSRAILTSTPDRSQRLCMNFTTYKILEEIPLSERRCLYCVILMTGSSVDCTSEADDHTRLSLFLLELKQSFSACKHRQLA